MPCGWGRRFRLPTSWGLPESGIFRDMSRTLFARLCAAALLFTGCWIAYTQTQAQPLTLSKVKDDLYMIEGDGGNVAVYVTSEGVILVDDKFEQDHDSVVVLLEFIVHQDNALAGDIHGDVAAIALDHVQIVLDLAEGKRLRLGLGVSDPAAREEQGGGAKACEQGAAHVWKYNRFGVGQALPPANPLGLVSRVGRRGTL